jgi:hypothetical protein
VLIGGNPAPAIVLTLLSAFVAWRLRPAPRLACHRRPDPAFLPNPFRSTPMTQQQQPPLIGIVLGSTREGRFGEKPAHWIHEIAKQRTDLAFELVDLRDHPLPFFNEAMRAPPGRR